MLNNLTADHVRKTILHFVVILEIAISNLKTKHSAILNVTPRLPQFQNCKFDLEFHMEYGFMYHIDTRITSENLQKILSLFICRKPYGRCLK